MEKNILPSPEINNSPNITEIIAGVGRLIEVIGDDELKDFIENRASTIGRKTALEMFQRNKQCLIKLVAIDSLEKDKFDKLKSFLSVNGKSHYLPIIHDVNGDFTVLFYLTG